MSKDAAGTASSEQLHQSTLQATKFPNSKTYLLQPNQTTFTYTSCLLPTPAASPPSPRGSPTPKLARLRAMSTTRAAHLPRARRSRAMTQRAD
ncbi:hypothetical protein HBI21_054160 [Parastagonospora nodorum]|nr:hypothetical protein HBH72_107710 [Parastagonospora nodorum]KAH5681692.1 hypothetical protein HBI21_054160 [Parastagonospora nodorum]